MGCYISGHVVQIPGRRNENKHQLKTGICSALTLGHTGNEKVESKGLKHVHTTLPLKKANFEKMFLYPYESEYYFIWSKGSDFWYISSKYFVIKGSKEVIILLIFLFVFVVNPWYYDIVIVPPRAYHLIMFSGYKYE